MSLKPSITRSTFILQAGALTAGSDILAARPSRAANLKPLRIAVAPSDGVTSVLYAKQAGLFEEAGLDVSLNIQRNGAAVAAAIISGVYDIGNSGVTTICVAHEKGLPFTLVAPAGVYNARNPYQGGIVTKESPLKLGADANNQTFGTVSLNDIGHDAFCGWVEQHGGDPRSLKFVEIPFSIAAQSVEQKRVVAAEIVTPTMTIALDTGAFRIIPIFNAIAPVFLTSAWFTSQHFSSQNTEIIRTFTRVVAEAATYSNSHHQETASLVAEFTKIPVSEIQRMPRAEQGTRLDPSLIQPVIDAAVKYGSLKASFPAGELVDSAVNISN